MLAAFLIAVLLATTVAVLSLGSVLVARHRAAAAADLAALAAAQSLPAGREQACRQAAALAAAMTVAVVGCDVDGLDVVVTVEVAVRFANGPLGPARAGARAGPPSG
ncbi:Rv3654c family TadE-like protein [Mycolicibacterium komossense]|uniref:Flp pilus-assembly TadE/G-like family protein n=1 Tax=Mycolicibacterium komossense TaxID=1779 RepID=A0ABT3CLN9_9MYCO|nr:Rv3654c family TadE-like protein [Mycolicibacterium komossense]MCV7230459.1 flp pilus-assembly TadE/G-like family protein [Mycolicibacterium komossense]